MMNNLLRGNSKNQCLFRYCPSCLMKQCMLLFLLCWPLHMQRRDNLHNRCERKSCAVPSNPPSYAKVGHAKSKQLINMQRGNVRCATQQHIRCHLTS